MSENMRVNSKDLLAGVLAGAMLLAPVQSEAQNAYPTADAAAAALVDAVSRKDEAAMRLVLGGDWKRVIPTMDIEDRDVAAFLGGWAEAHKIVNDTERTAHLVVGANAWALPIPLAEKNGAWRFDTRAGADEMKTRRIGRNELAAMQAALAYFDAQKEYAREDRDGNGVLEYAQKIVSTPGKQDGLYWAALPGEAASPLGPLYGETQPGREYHGYRYRILAAQGKDAPGGAYDYRIGNRLIAGFALVAWPAKYADSGVMSYVISHDGVLYENNLGPKTDAAARAMSHFNPDGSWKKVNP
jgi:hypothetical protein